MNAPSLIVIVCFISTEAVWLVGISAVDFWRHRICRGFPGWREGLIAIQLLTVDCLPEPQIVMGENGVPLIK